MHRHLAGMMLAAAALLGGAAIGAEPSGAVAGDSGVWINGQYFGHNPGGRAAVGSPPATSTPARSPSNRQVKAAAFDALPADYEEAYPDGPYIEEPYYEEVPLAGDDYEPSCELDLGCVDCCSEVGCGGRVGYCLSGLYARAEYVGGWAKGADAPALVTTSDTGTAQGDAGVLGLATTTVLYGQDDVNDSAQSGARFTLGAPLGGRRSQRVEFVFWFMQDAGEEYAASSDDLGILARPFFNVTDGEQDALLIGFPALTEGTLGVAATSEFRSYELGLLQDACCWQGGLVELLLGYRATELDDGLAIRQSFTSLSGPTSGSQNDLTDLFSTSNTFHGGQLGFSSQLLQHGRLSADCLVKTAIGQTRMRARIQGSTTVTVPSSGSTTTDAGLLTQGTNIGEYTQSEFGSITELGVNVRYRLRPAVSLTLGYNVVFWSEVMRAAEQIDLGVNATQIPPGTLTGDPRPGFLADPSGYWVQGLRAGLEARW